MRVLTFGHGTASQEEIAGLLRGAGVELVVDVRTAPGSRRNPHVSRTELSRWLSRPTPSTVRCCYTLMASPP